MFNHPLFVYGVFLGYLAVTLYIGYIGWRKTKNARDYFLAGRRLGPWTIALSVGASGVSAGLFLAGCGLAFVAGYGACWMMLGLLLGVWANWLIVAKRFRIYTEIANNSITLPTYFSNRFNDKSQLLKAVCGFFSLLFLLFYISSGLVAFAKLFSVILDLDYNVLVGIGALLVLSYMLFGGFHAVCHTDVVQAVLIIFAFVVVPIAALQEVGGLAHVLTGMEQLNPALVDPWTDNQGIPLGLIGILSLLAWGLGCLGQPHVLIRFAAIIHEDKLPLARRIDVSWNAITLIGVPLIGFAGIIYVQQYLGGRLADPEMIFVILADRLFHPAVAATLFIALLAAIMSTADSQLLVCSSILAEDFYRGFFNREASSKTVVRVGQMGVILVTLIALLFAYNENASVLSLVAYAWAGFGAAFGPALVASLYWRRMTRNGALAGMLVGGLAVVVWHHLSGGLFDLYEMVPGVLFAWIAIVCVSLMDKPPGMSITIFFDMMKKAAKKPKLQNR